MANGARVSEWRRYADAVGFLTVVPVRFGRDLAPDWLARSAKYFPLVGLKVGVCAALALLGAGLLWNATLTALIAVAAAILLTGALHEDGLADAADGLCGGATPERRLAIMRDSRIGGYGALALILAVTLKVAALAAMTPTLGAAALVAAHAGGRLAAILPMAAMRYAGDPASRKIAAGALAPRPGECALAVVFAGLGFAPLFLLAPVRCGLGLALGALFAALTCSFAQRRVGGHTGDVLGAAEQCFEIGLLVGASAAL